MSARLCRERVTAGGLLPLETYSEQSPMESERSYKYDVAFSFLAADLSVAKDLQGRLEPGLAVFMYERRKEELLGRDGMDVFSEVFRRDTRLSVILYRKGWGETAWTGFEESAIKSRALDSTEPTCRHGFPPNSFTVARRPTRERRWQRSSEPVQKSAGRSCEH